jgi:phosphoribosylaminoimidazole-succinocarboxamide synthase
MGTTDDELDATSRRLLDEIEELRHLELLKRQTARGSKEFQDLAFKVDDAARHIFDTAGAQLIDGTDESPLQAERDEQHPGDWTEGSRDDLR